ncbi:hypothetical protein ACJX0J_025307, partial [Zea mays]
MVIVQRLLFQSVNRRHNAIPTFYKVHIDTFPSHAFLFLARCGFSLSKNDFEMPKIPIHCCYTPIPITQSSIKLCLTLTFVEEGNVRFAVTVTYVSFTPYTDLNVARIVPQSNYILFLPYYCIILYNI